MKPLKLPFTAYDEHQWAAIKHFLHGIDIDAEQLVEPVFMPGREQVPLRAVLEYLTVQYFRRSQLKSVSQWEWEQQKTETLKKIVALRCAFAPPLNPEVGEGRFERLFLCGGGFREKTADQLADEAFRLLTVIEQRVRTSGSIYDFQGYDDDDEPTTERAEKALRTDYLRKLIRIWEQITDTKKPQRILARFLLVCAEPVGVNLKAIQYSLRANFS